jgi:hypothetical protein
MKPILLSAVFCLLSVVAHARINVVTLPTRDTVQLTIYNSADLTMVRETRFLTLRKGLNRLEFSWANTLIDPTSVEFRALTHADTVEVLDVSFPPRVTNTLEWRIQSEVAGEVQVEIRYFTSGISWGADYTAHAGQDEKHMTLAGNVRVTNNSGEDYENAEIRLVVGVVRLVEEVARLARGGELAAAKPMTVAFREMKDKRFEAYDALNGAAIASEARPREIIKEGFSEYFLYTVEGRDTIPTGWSKRLPSFTADDVPIASHYKFEREQWGDQVIRFYRFKNDKDSHLGNEPLPDGAVKAFRLVSADALLSFVGHTRVKYIPLDEQVELELGHDLEVLVKPTLMHWEKMDLRFDNDGRIAGWTIRETWQIEVQNSRDIDTRVDIRRSFAGDWSVATEAKFEKVDAGKIKFLVPLKAHEQHKLTYELTTRHGLNATR